MNETSLLTIVAFTKEGCTGKWQDFLTGEGKLYSEDVESSQSYPRPHGIFAEKSLPIKKELSFFVCIGRKLE